MSRTLRRQLEIVNAVMGRLSDSGIMSQFQRSLLKFDRGEYIQCTAKISIYHYNFRQFKINAKEAKEKTLGFDQHCLDFPMLGNHNGVVNGCICSRIRILSNHGIWFLLARRLFENRSSSNSCKIHSVKCKQIKPMLTCVNKEHDMTCGLPAKMANA